MPRRYNRLKAKAASERGKRMASARWKLDRERRDSESAERLRDMAEIEAMNYPRRQGDPIGCLQWHDFRTGKVRRWTISIGDRIDRVTMRTADGKSTKSHGWTWITDHLRGFFSGAK